VVALLDRILLKWKYHPVDEYLEPEKR